MYEDKEIQDKILSDIPIQKLEKEAQLKSNENKTSYKDEFVKSLLAWFKKDYFTWCDKPLCTLCGTKSEQLITTDKPNEEENKWLCSRTEVYKCTCGNICRFPRYNNPKKLSETRTGRCGEWANLFGCILRSFKYEVRFVDNFEDHVWNEYWSEAHNKVVDL
jgi:peptide-N4-(N-acetyl-beta-glucosaminyl)asparagine amidase